MFSYILHLPVGFTQICSPLQASKSIFHSPENKQRDVISYKRLQEEITWQEKKINILQQCEFYNIWCSNDVYNVSRKHLIDETVGIKWQELVGWYPPTKG